MTLSLPRLLFGAAVVVLAGFAWLDAAAASMFRINPDFVLGFRPGDPQSLRVVVDRRTLGEKIIQPTAEEARTLRAALLQRPLSESILRQLAMADRLDGRSQQAMRLLDVSNRVSRRDLLTELLLAEHAARANEPETALRHFDAAMSANSQASELMFGPLAKTLEEPDFQGYVARYLSRPWAPAFLDAAVRSSDPVDLLATVTKNDAVQREERFRRFRGDLVTRLVNEGYPAEAFAYAAKGPAEEAAPIAVVGFTRKTTDPGLGPLLWRLANTGGIFASLSDSTLVIDIDAASTGTAVQRIFALAPGAYALAANARATDLTEEMSGEWQVACLVRGAIRPLAQVRVAFPAEAQVTRLPFRIPQGCEAALVALTVHNLDDQRDAQIEITGFTLDKAGA